MWCNVTEGSDYEKGEYGEHSNIGRDDRAQVEDRVRVVGSISGDVISWNM